MRAMIKSTFPLGGYTVRNENGKVILQKRWKDGARQNAVLPLAWEQTNALDVAETIHAVNGHMTSGTGINLKEAVRLLLPVESHEGGVTVNWGAIAKAPQPTASTQDGLSRKPGMTASSTWCVASWKSSLLLVAPQQASAS